MIDMTPHARVSDPVQSHITVKSLDEDTSLKGLIYRAIKHLEHAHDGTIGVTDDEIWQYLEAFTGRRFQRNVIARTRGLMINDGYVFQVHDRIIGNQHRIACRVSMPTYDQPSLFEETS